MNCVNAPTLWTPIGNLIGAFANVSGVELGTIAAKSVLAELEVNDVADVIVGNVLQAGLGMNPARQIALLAGLSHITPGQTINRVCGSGLPAVVTAVQGLKSDDGHLYLVGSVENMTLAPHLLLQMRVDKKLGPVAMEYSMVHDDLSDPLLKYHMGMTGENICGMGIAIVIKVSNS